MTDLAARVEELEVKVGKLRGRTSHLEKRIKDYKVHQEPREYLLDGYTPEGQVAVLANALGIVGETLQKLESELQKDVPSNWVVNGFLLSVIPGIQNLLDNIARMCQSREPIDDFTNRDFYFHEYTFIRASFVSLNHLQRKANSVRYKEAPWYYFANAFKHGAPWAGLCKEHRTTHVQDVYDTSNVGLVYSVLVPVYKLSCSMLKELAKVYKAPQLSFPSV